MKYPHIQLYFCEADATQGHLDPGCPSVDRDVPGQNKRGKADLPAKAGKRNDEIMWSRKYLYG
jgi:hypothetical protein